jgi:raffinose/stachyose/melibiose transport system substrate-binding protein
VAAAAAAAAVLPGLAGCGQADDRVRLDFFQFKGEARTDFDALAKAFEAENPDIDVVVNNVPDPDTAIRTLLVKGRAPDVATLNGSGNFASLAVTGVFHDFAGDPILDQINPAPLGIVNGLGTFHGSEVNALPYISNADGILYNRAIFAAHGLETPRTWDELIEVCDSLETAGVTPFAGTLADAWTALPSLNGLGAYATRDGLLDRMKASGTDFQPGSPDSFQGAFAEVLERQQQLFGHMGAGYRGRSYDDGNAAFAAGEVAMLLQGSWAVSQIRAIDPTVDVGVFPYPWDTPEERVVVSGVDIAVAISRDTPRLEEAKRFVEFLFRADNIEKVAASQAMFSAHADSPGTSDPTLREIQPFFDAGRIAPFLDHQVPAAVPLQQIDQRFLLDSDLGAALASLDSEWRKVAIRTNH